MEAEKFATNLAIYLRGTTLDTKDYRDTRQKILDFLERQETWFIVKTQINVNPS
jgi:hypothetical protein